MFLENYEDIKDCIVIDTETVTDEITRISKVWEIGIVVVSNEQIVDTINVMVNPDAKFERLDLRYPDELETIEKIKSSNKFSDIFPEIKKHLHPDFIIGGHNTDFDLKVINRELALLGEEMIGSKKIDTIRLARKVHPDWTRYNLDAVCKEYGLGIENRHRALDDAYATAEAYLIMRKKLMAQDLNASTDTLGLF
jgi:DNA polymerase III epsilon subunit-like protein